MAEALRLRRGRREGDRQGGDGGKSRYVFPRWTLLVCQRLKDTACGGRPEMPSGDAIDARR
jgi:hypothetical protein